MSGFSRSSHLIFGRPLGLVPVTFILNVLLEQITPLNDERSNGLDTVLYKNISFYHQIQEEMRMELESQHLDDFEDIFAFRDDNHHSPSQTGG